MMTAEQREKVREALTDIHWREHKLSVMEAAVFSGITEDRIRQWKRRGHLQPVDTDEFGRPLFRAVDVFQAMAKAEDNAARTQARNLAARRASPAA